MRRDVYRFRLWPSFCLDAWEVEFEHAVNSELQKFEQQVAAALRGKGLARKMLWAVALCFVVGMVVI